MYFVKYCCSCNVFGGTVKLDEEKKEEDIFSYLKRYLLLLVFINIGKYSWIDLATKFSIGKLAKKNHCVPMQIANRSYYSIYYITK